MITLWRWRGDPAAPGGPQREVGPPGDWSQDDRITGNCEFRADPDIEMRDFVDAQVVRQILENNQRPGVTPLPRWAKNWLEDALR